MTDRDREAFEAWWKTADRVVLDRYWAEEAWEAALDHAREAGAQEPVAVPEGYWLAPLTLTPELRAAGAAGSGEDSEAVAEGAYEAIRDAVLAATPVSPAADSGAGCPHCSGTGQRQDKRTGKSYPCPRCEPSPSQWNAGAEAEAFKVGALADREMIAKHFQEAAEDSEKYMKELPTGSLAWCTHANNAAEAERVLTLLRLLPLPTPPEG